MDSKEFKLLRGRFEDSVTDAVEKFTESISFDKDLYKHDIMDSRAHASMLARQGLMTEDDKNCILKRLDEIEGPIERGEFVWRTDREDVHMNMEAARTDLVGEPAKKLHTARSRNDQVCTDFRLWCRDAIDNIVMHVKHLQVVLVKLAQKTEGLIVPGYTHSQRAQPVLLRDLVLAHVEQLARDAGRLLDCRERMNFILLGARALAGTDLPIDRSMTSEAVGFIASMRNRAQAQAREFWSQNFEPETVASADFTRTTDFESEKTEKQFCETSNKVTLRESPNKDKDEGSGRGGDGIWIRTLAGVGLVIGGVVGLYLVYKTGRAIEREIVGAVRDWKEAGFPALVKIKIEKVGLKFSIY